MRMVEKHIERKRSLVLPVISAQIPYHIHTGLATIQKIRKSDVGLADRVVGVITKPDQAMNIDKIFGILEGRLDLTGGRIRWNMVKNQGNNERQQTLEQKDVNEEQFLF
jgi:hypothetical protein